MTYWTIDIELCLKVCIFVPSLCLSSPVLRQKRNLLTVGFSFVSALECAQYHLPSQFYHSISPLTGLNDLVSDNGSLSISKLGDHMSFKLLSNFNPSNFNFSKVLECPIYKIILRYPLLFNRKGIIVYLISDNQLGILFCMQIPPAWQSFVSHMIWINPLTIVVKFAQSFSTCAKHLTLFHMSLYKQTL